jgi:pimeloyl-ACP methyl ester carboxylesterase
MNAEPLQRRVLAPAPGSDVLSGLCYVDTGGPGAPVVLQHGLCGSADQTSELFPAEGDARFMTLECRGHGQSAAGPFEMFSFATFTEDLRALVESTAAAPLIVGGISMGAAIAKRLAVKYPHLVRALILVRPAWVCEAAPENVWPNLEVGRLLGRLAPSAAKAEFLAGETACQLERESPDNLASLTGFFDREPTAVTAELLRRISLDGPGIETVDLSRLRVPALVIGCAEDAIHPLETAQTLAQLLPDACFVQVTPKSIDRRAYVREIRSAISQFVRSHTA